MAVILNRSCNLINSYERNIFDCVIFHWHLYIVIIELDLNNFVSNQLIFMLINYYYRNSLFCVINYILQNNCPIKHLVYDINCHCKHILQTFLGTDHLKCLVGREVYFSTRTTTIFFLQENKSRLLLFSPKFFGKSCRVGLFMLCIFQVNLFLY